MRLFTLLFFLGLHTIVAGQQWKTESVKRQIAETREDSNQVKLIAELSYLYTDIDVDSALHYANRGMALAEKIQYSAGKAYCLVSLGRAYMHFGNNELALERLSEALHLFENLNIISGKGYAIANLGILHAYLQNTQISIEYANKARKIAEEIKDSSLLVLSLLKLCDSYSSENQNDSFLIVLKEAEKISLLLKDTIFWARSMAYLDIYHETNDSEISMQFRKKALFLFSAIGNNRGIAQNFSAIANAYARMNNVDSAIYYSTLSLDLARKHHFAFIAIHRLSAISKLYEGNNDAEALRYYKIYKEESDKYYSINKQQLLENVELKNKSRIRETEISEKIYRNRIVQYALMAGLILISLMALAFYRNKEIKRKSNLHLAKTLEELKATQNQLIQSEKMASLGELTAGIAHEIQNPLNFVNNFSEVSSELLDEMKQELATGNKQQALDIAEDVKQNLEKILLHGKRADGIVKGMLMHSRSSAGIKEPTDINALADEYLRLAYHGMRAKDKAFNATIKTDFDDTIGNINVIPQDIGRVLLNLITNAFHAVSEKQKSLQTPYPLKAGDEFVPTVSIKTKKLLPLSGGRGSDGAKVTISISDNGTGIPDAVKDKIFQPFFTTKPTGQGTGLGLSLSYDIIKAHGGNIILETKEGIGSTFTITLPGETDTHSPGL